jgi:FkbM family methyltransferase
VCKITLHPDSLQTWYADGLERLRYEYQLSPNDTVIDVGAFEGEWASHIYRDSHCKCIVIEPGAEISTFPHGKIINKAAATHNGMLSLGGDRFARSIFNEGYWAVECFDINSLLNEEIAILKLNVEGSEYDLLEHIIGNGKHKNIRNIQVQFHQVEGVPYEIWYNAIAKMLSETHELTWRYPFCWENWRRLV